MIEKIDISKIQEPLEKASSKQSGPTSPVSKNNEDVSVQVDYASLIEQATQPIQTDTEVIQRVRMLLESDQLESEENILEAIKNMVMFGI